MPELRVNGQPIRVPEGTSLLAALDAAGAMPLHPAPDGTPRAPLCGMGSCQDCRVWLNGLPVLSCLTRAEEGMEVHTHTPPAGDWWLATGDPLHTELLVVGAGPAGLEGALAAASGGVRVLLLDAAPGPGGQIWRGARAGKGQAGGLIARVEAEPNISLLHGASVVAVLEAGPEGFAFLVVQAGLPITVRARRVLLATGALERFLPFPGWTLPGITGAGALQVMAKGGLEVRGQRVLVAGSGPLLLAVAAGLRERGARVLGVAEVVPPARLAAFGLGAVRAGKLGQALGLGWALRGVPYWPGSLVLEAHGGERLEAVTLRRGARTVRLSVDRLAVGFGLVPETRLARALGCALTPGGAVRVNAYGLTSVPGVWAAGEVTGIGGVEAARAGGRVAGLVLSGQVEALPPALAERDRQAAFGEVLERAFAPGPELRSLPTSSTTVCRCEAVTHGQIASHTSWREAKLHTRCGMGACQGRVCGPATRFLYGLDPDDTPRAPLLPVPLQALMEGAISGQPSAIGEKDHHPPGLMAES